MAGTRTQLESLAKSLSTYDPKQSVEWQVGEVANALIGQAKEEEPDSAVLKAIKPFTPGQEKKYINGVYAAGVRTIAQQAAEAIPRRIAIA